MSIQKTMCTPLIFPTVSLDRNICFSFDRGTILKPRQLHLPSSIHWLQIFPLVLGTCLFPATSTVNVWTHVMADRWIRDMVGTWVQTWAAGPCSSMQSPCRQKRLSFWSGLLPRNTHVHVASIYEFFIKQMNESKKDLQILLCLKRQSENFFQVFNLRFH